MTTISPAPARRPDVAWALTGLSLALALLCLPGLLTDPRTLDGVSVWAKPAKFAVSFVVYFATIALVTERLSPAGTESRVIRASLVAMAIAMLGEMGYILQQAALGEASHFNRSTPYHAAAYTLMGIGAAVLVIAMGAVGVRAALDRDARLAPGVRLGIATGFAGSALLTLVIGFTLGGNAGHFIGTPSPGAPAIPLMGWSAEVGDLRPAHFLALHGMQILPLLGLAFDRLAPGAARPGVLLGTVLWAGLSVALYAQALAGLPLIRL
jgi:hypothetical protein